MDRCFNADSVPISMTHTTEESLIAKDNVTESANYISVTLMHNNSIPLTLIPERRHDLVTPVKEEHGGRYCCGRVISNSVRISAKSDVSQIGRICNNENYDALIGRSSERKQIAEIVRREVGWKSKPHKDE